MNYIFNSQWTLSVRFPPQTSLTGHIEVHIQMNANCMSHTVAPPPERRPPYPPFSSLSLWLIHVRGWGWGPSGCLSVCLCPMQSGFDLPHSPSHFMRPCACEHVNLASCVLYTPLTTTPSQPPTLYLWLSVPASGWAWPWWHRWLMTVVFGLRTAEVVRKKGAMEHSPCLSQCDRGSH